MAPLPATGDLRTFGLASFVGMGWRRGRPRRAIAARAATYLAAMVAACFGICQCTATAAASQPLNFLDLADQGISQARTHWWNSGARWWNDNLDPNLAYEYSNGVHIPLGTVWSLTPLFEAIDGLQLAEPSASHRKAVRDFAIFADTHYWNRDLFPHGGWSAYPGDHGADAHVFFDDNGWWGLAFLDAYRATRNKRFLSDAKKTLDFINARGWVGQGFGMRKNNWEGHRSIEALGAAAALAAGIYEQTRNKRFRDIAHTYIHWANHHAWRSYSGLYATVYPPDTQPEMTYVEGAMIGAHLSLCRTGNNAACDKAAELAEDAISWAGWYPAPDQGPQLDTVLFRYLVQLSALTGDTRWWDWARRNATRAFNKARTDGLYLKLWNGDPVTSKRGQELEMHYGQIQTHASAIALFAWLAAFPRP